MKMMKNIALAPFLTRGPIVMGMLLVGSLFFGCKQPQNQSLLSSAPATDAAATALLNVPFGYDLAVDTISYNSCVGDDLKSAGIPGIKMGVNEGFVDTNGSGAVKGGLKLRSEFLQYVVKNITPNFPATSISPNQIKYLLKNSANNQNLYIQYGVRLASNLQLAPDLINGGAAAENRDGLYETSPLSDDPILTNITKNVTFGSTTVLSEGPRIYNASTGSAPKAFEASFGYSSNVDSSFPITQGADDSLGAGEEYSDKVRAKFNAGTLVLAQTYGNPLLNAAADGINGLNSPQRASATSTDLTKAFGRSFNLSFTTRNASLGSWRKNILNRITERNLEDGRQVAGVSWTCDYAVIMKSSQLNSKKSTEPACSQLLASDLEDPSVSARVKNLRRHYSEGDWTIGLYYPKNALYNPATRLAVSPAKLCIVPKSAECYLPTVGLILSAPAEDVGIQYDESQECYLSRFAPMGVSYSGGKTGDEARRIGRCPQYASVCVRNSTSY